MRSLLCVGLILGALSASAEEGSWTDKIKMSGDVRIRHDMVLKDNVSDHHRERFRARFGLVAKVNEDMQAKFRLASADNGDAISNNTTMTDNGSKKPAYIDLASIQWKMAEDLSLDLGKIENGLRVLPTSQLIFDSDYTPEGALIDGKIGGLFAKVGAFSLAERAPDTNGHSEPDAWLTSAMVGTKYDCECGKGWLAAVGYHAFTGLKDNPVLFTSAGSTKFYNNSSYTATAGDRYKFDYRVMEIVGEYHFKYENRKISLFADAISNTEVSQEHQGLLVGMGYTVLDDADKAKWSFTYNYRTVDRDATVAALNDSDYASGYNGSQGHTVVLTKSVLSNAQVGVTYFVAQVDEPSKSYETQRGLFDFSVSF